MTPDWAEQRRPEEFPPVNRILWSFALQSEGGMRPELHLRLSASLCTLIQIYQTVAWPPMPQLTSCSMCFRLLLGDTKQLYKKQHDPVEAEADVLKILCAAARHFHLLQHKHRVLHGNPESTWLSRQQRCGLHHACCPKRLQHQRLQQPLLQQQPLLLPDVWFLHQNNDTDQQICCESSWPLGSETF